jgi:hypothetical protein
MKSYGRFYQEVGMAVPPRRADGYDRVLKILAATPCANLSNECDSERRYQAELELSGPAIARKRSELRSPISRSRKKIGSDRKGSGRLIDTANCLHRRRGFKAGTGDSNL